MKAILGFTLIGTLLLSCNYDPHKQTDTDLLRSYCTISTDTAYSNGEWVWKLIPDSVFDNKQIIACGQSTHGSRENFLIQTSIFKKLVQEKGVRVFVLEAAYSDILEVNDYVTTGVGIKDSIATNLTFDIWKKEEMLELIEWVREFNLTRTEDDKILFLGCSVQEVDITIDAVKTFFGMFYPEDKNQVEQILVSFNKDSVLKNMSNPDETVRLLKSKIDELRLLATTMPELPDSNERIGYLLYKRSIDLLDQILASIDQSRSERRGDGDSIMAVNLKWIVDNHFRQGPVFLWAHNMHITFEEPDYSKEKLLGMYLYEAYGDDYYSIGIDFISGSIRTQTTYHDSTPDLTKVIPVAESDSAYLNYYISNLNGGLVLFRYDQARKDSLFLNSTLFWNGHKIHNLGVVFGGNGLNLNAHYFNSIIFYPHATPTRQIEKGR
mgnify:CR=1 FL=1